MESSSDTPQRNTPAEDLALIDQTQQSLAAPRGFSLVYDTLFSLLCGVFVTTPAVPSEIRTYVTFAVALALVGLVLWWRRRLGWWVSGYSPRRARWVGIGLVLALIGLMMWVGALPALPVAITAGAVGVIVAFGASRLWTHVWRRERVEKRTAA